MRKITQHLALNIPRPAHNQTYTTYMDGWVEGDRRKLKLRWGPERERERERERESWRVEGWREGAREEGTADEGVSQKSRAGGWMEGRKEG